MAKNERFERIYSQGTMNVTEMFHACGQAGGMTPLLDREGKPVVSPIMNI